MDDVSDPPLIMSGLSHSLILSCTDEALDGTPLFINGLFQFLNGDACCIKSFFCRYSGMVCSTLREMNNVFQHVVTACFSVRWREGWCNRIYCSLSLGVSDPPPVRNGLIQVEINGVLNLLLFIENVDIVVMETIITYSVFL